MRLRIRDFKASIYDDTQKSHFILGHYVYINNKHMLFLKRVIFHPELLERASRYLLDSICNRWLYRKKKKKTLDEFE